MPNNVKSFCRNCGALCSMELSIDNNKIIAVKGDDTASPYGGYMCAKGRASADFHNVVDNNDVANNGADKKTGAENRLLHSLKRDPENNFCTISPASAMDEIAEKISALIAQHGPRSIAFFHGTGAYRSTLGGLLERAFVSEIGSPNFFSTMTIDQSAKWVTSGRMGMMASGKPSTRDIDLAVIAGNNPIVTHQTYPFSAGESGAPSKSLTALKERGGKIIVIDPRKTETARYADLLIQPLAGHDAAIFAAIAHILLRDNTYNKNFCERFVTQLDKLRAAVAPFTPELAAQRADVPVEQIELAAQWIGEAKRAFIGSGTGPSMSAHSNLNDHMIEVVNALVGGYRRAGDLVRNPGTLKPRHIYETVVPAGRSWERGAKCRTVDIGTLYGEFPTALLPQEILTPGPDKIRALIVFGGNPLMALGDPDRAIPAFEDLELLISLDARMNETAQLAHYVIATTQHFERADLSIAGDSLYPEAFAQYAPPILPKPGETIHDWEFFWGIASRMNIPLTLKYWNYGLNYATIPGGLALDMKHAPSEEEMFRFLCKDSRVPFDELLANPSGVRPALSSHYVKAMDDNGERLQLCPSDVAAELNIVLNEKPQSDFKYQLTCRRILEAMNSAYRDSDRTLKKYPTNWAYMNPLDMQDNQIEENSSVEIESEVGCIRGIARADKGLRRGIISMTHLYGSMEISTDPLKQRGSHTGRLTSLQNYLEPINFMPRFSGIPVNIKVTQWR